MINQRRLFRPVDAAETRLKIVRAAADEFSSLGFRAATVQGIAALAKVNEVTVYRHFPQKKDLYWEAIDWKMCNLAQGLSASYIDRSRPEETLLDLSQQILGILRSDQSIVRIVCFTILELEAERNQLRDQYFLPFIEAIERQLRRLVISGKLSQIDPRSAALMILGLMIGHANLRSLLGKEMGPQPTENDLTKSYVNFLLMRPVHAALL